MIIRCLYCDKEFTERRGKKKFCSKTCRTAQYNKEYKVILQSKLPNKTCPLCSTVFDSTSKYCDYCRKRLRQLYDCKRSAKYGSKIQKIATDRKKYFETLSDEEFYEQVAKPIVDNKIGDWESHYFNNLEQIIYKLAKGIVLNGAEQRIVNGIINRG